MELLFWALYLSFALSLTALAAFYIWHGGQV
jgi:hypothetical protein